MIVVKDLLAALERSFGYQRNSDMTSYNDYKVIKNLEQIADQHGFDIRADIYGTGYGSPTDFALHPSKKLAVYNTDMRMVSGSAEEMTYFLIGWSNCIRYMNVLGIVDEKKIARATQKYLDKIRSDRVIKSLTRDNC
jgi:hypothetical protein